MKPVTLWSLAIGTLAVGGLGGDAASAKPPETSARVELASPIPVGRVKLQHKTVDLSVRSLAQGGAAHSVANGVAISADVLVPPSRVESETLHRGQAPQHTR